MMISAVSFFSIVTFLLLLFLQTEGLICLSSFCPNGVFPCNDYCTGQSDVCHLLAHSLDLVNFTTIEMSCSHSTLDCSSECNLERTVYGNVHYCCCNTDYCNHVPGETDHLLPSLDIGTNQPSDPKPVASNGTICEEYRCTEDEEECIHRYKVCEPKDGKLPYCSSSYLVNGERKLELIVKDCEYELPDKCHNNTACHVDNPLNGEENDFYFCCCNTSYCNQNETFTHPTQHVNYGLKECEALECDHTCVIKNNIPSCVCDEGFESDEDMANKCKDIDECAVGITKCDEETENCVNYAGGSRCDCKPGFFFEPKLQVCLDDDGVICGSYGCDDITDNSTCVTGIEHCALTAPEALETQHSAHFCQATFRLVNDSFVPAITSCIHGSHVACNNDKCVLNVSSEAHFFCCCYGDLCNTGELLVFPWDPDNSPSLTALSVSSSIILPSVTISASSDPNIGPPESISNIFVSPVVIGITVSLLVSVLLIVGVVMAICILKYYVRQKHYVQTTIEEDMVPEENQSPLMLKTPTLETVIGQGRFAKVYCTELNERQVAIKIFNNTFQAKESWSREKNIYSTPELQHPNILKFLDAERRMHEGVDAFWLIFEYQPNGSLYDYLQHRTVTLKEFCSLSSSAAHGLAHLHSELSRGNVIKKPPIAHRDLKSKNILVKSDMTSCISDFGLAIKLNQGEHPSDAQGQVGTSRYMAPEVLEGAISFHQESFLRIDVYAFGLVLWEIASRCDIPGNSVSEYRPPFEDIVSPNPSIGEMKAIVAEQQKRPKMPRGFQNNMDYETVVDTITESWDRDAEARPSAHLIETRLKNFCELIDPKLNLKESGYLSHHPLPSPINLTSSDNPLPLTPSSSPCATLSPSDTKTMRFDSSSYFMSSYHSVIDSGNISDELRDKDNTVHKECSSALLDDTACKESITNKGDKLSIQKNPQHPDCHHDDGTTVMNQLGQLETSI